ncbi:MAG: hypothetical protein KIS96_08255 [Bauldia sp.]|nr:hypothetical protein [Bauldia sp.]
MIPNSFRKIRLELAREPGHPEGEAGHGYDLLAPLDAEGRLDPAEWRAHRGECRVRRFRTGEADQIGTLSRRPGGSWFFDYEEGDEDDESGFRLGDERFVPGEYVSLRERDGKMHTFRVILVEAP